MQGKNASANNGERSGVLSWDDYFMSIAVLTAMRSKDPYTQVGACIVNDLNRIIGVGYNGFPSGVAGDALPWARESPEGELATKYPYVVHAELNAIMNKNAESCRGCRLYSTLFPCNECAKVIIQSGIRKVIYSSDKHHNLPSATASRRLFELAGVESSRHTPQNPNLQVTLRYPDDEPLPEPLICGPAGDTDAVLAGRCLDCGCACGGDRRAAKSAAGTWPEPLRWTSPLGGMALAAIGTAAVAVLLACRRQGGAAR